MFYSETLLQKTGPLAKVWLAANVERKLTKGDCLKQNITKDVRNIVNDEQAPLALRLTSQLLLGVVRIYSRKARYLLDDCNEALIKIKLAFRPGNVDLPSTQSHVANPAAITMQDAITELDLFAPIPGLDDLLGGPSAALFADGQSQLDWGTSQVLPDSLDDSRSLAGSQLNLDDDDLGLDIGGDVTAPSIEVGRRAEAATRNDAFLAEEDDLGLDLGLGDTTIREPTIVDDDGFHIGNDDFAIEQEIAEGNKAALARAGRERESLSPLSDLGDEQAQELEQTFQFNMDDTEEQEDQDATQVQAQQRVKRRKVLQNDDRIELNQSQIKAMQKDRSAILGKSNLFPRDDFLNTLFNMSRNGQFVSQYLGDQSLPGLAPQLRGILSIEVVRKSGELKRKRLTSGTQPDATQDEAQADDPLPEDEQAPITENDGFQPIPEDDEFNLPQSPGIAPFDETTIAPVPPSASGPVSLATKHTVHMLRERFSTSSDPNEPPSPGTRAAQSVAFGELCPPSITTRTDATKLFFETLVLATKDAIKVEQRADEGLGAEFRIRAKRGLWGSWAEMGVGGTAEDEEGEGEDNQAGEAEGMEGIEVA